CWRDCREIGTLYHIWWECPKIQVFWKKIVHLVGMITEINVRLEICLFHSTELSVSLYKDSGIWFFLNAAKGLIPKFWCKKEVPREKDWVARVNQICELEKLYYMHVDKMGTYYVRWKKWEEF
ncbi:unnamed protein product, partial [Staurois parvus]